MNASEASRERQGKLVEEQGEVGQALGKLITYGAVSRTMSADGKTELLYNNTADLEREIGDLLGVIDMMVLAGDLDRKKIDQARKEKLANMPRYLNHQPPYVLEAMRVRAEGIPV